MRRCRLPCSAPTVPSGLRSWRLGEKRNGLAKGLHTRWRSRGHQEPDEQAWRSRKFRILTKPQTIAATTRSFYWRLGFEPTAPPGHPQHHRKVRRGDAVLARLLINSPVPMTQAPHPVLGAARRHVILHAVSILPRGKSFQRCRSGHALVVIL